MSHVIRTSGGTAIVATEYRIEQGGTLWYWSTHDTGHYLAAHAWKSIDLDVEPTQPASPRGAIGNPAENPNNLSF